MIVHCNHCFPFSKASLLYSQRSARMQKNDLTPHFSTNTVCVSFICKCYFLLFATDAKALYSMAFKLKWYIFIPSQNFSTSGDFALVTVISRCMLYTIEKSMIMKDDGFDVYDWIFHLSYCYFCSTASAVSILFNCQKIFECSAFDPDLMCNNSSHLWKLVL